MSILAAILDLITKTLLILIFYNFVILSNCSSMRNDEKKNAILFKSYPFYMKYKQNSLFGGHFGRHLEFQYEESTFRLDTQAKKFANCITVNIQPSNLFSGGGGTKLFFCPIGFCTTVRYFLMLRVHLKILQNIQRIQELQTAYENRKQFTISLNGTYAKL